MPQLLPPEGNFGSGSPSGHGSVQSGGVCTEVRRPGDSRWRDSERGAHCEGSGPGGVNRHDGVPPGRHHGSSGSVLLPRWCQTQEIQRYRMREGWGVQFQGRVGCGVSS